MGKLKLTKANKRKKPASGIPNWLLTTIVAVVIVAVLATCIATFVSTSGVTMRWRSAMKTEDYKVSGNMMKYYYMSTYSNFSNTYSTYMPYFSIGQGTPVSEHDDIVFGGTAENPNTYDTLLLGEFDGTWFDYFMNSTRESVQSLLIYCEKADELGITVTDEEKTEIETSIDSAIAEFRTSQMSPDLSETTCLAAMYGEGMKRSDIRKAMELSTLASKCQEQIIEDIRAGVDETKINTEYDANALEYDLVDYIKYSFDVTYKEAAEWVLGTGYADSSLEENKTAVNEKYQAMIAEAKAKAEALKNVTTLEDYKAAVLADIVSETNYDSLLTAKKLESDKLPTEEQLAIIKTTVLANVVAEYNSGADEAADDVVETKAELEGAASTYTIYGINITKEFADAIKSVKSSLLVRAQAIEDSYTVRKATYTADDAFSTWAFSTDRKVGDINHVLEGDGSTDAAFEVKDESFSAEVTYLLTTRYKYNDLTRNVGYMMFESKDEATAAITLLQGLNITDYSQFEAAATDAKAALCTLYEDYVEGAMQSTTFDDWLYDDATVAGTITAEPLVMTDGSYMVAYYVSDGDVAWRVNVRNTLINEEYTAFEEQLKSVYSATIYVDEWVMSQIGKAY